MASIQDESRLKVFVSYSRKQRVVADQMVENLLARDFDVVIDRRDLPYGEEWQNELSELVRGSDTVVWLASEHSVASQWCNWELDEARRLSKRLVPVRVGRVSPEALPETLRRIHLLPAQGIYKPADHLDELVQTLNNDRKWIRQYTRLADQASVWIGRGKPVDRLLRGRALTEAETWLDSRAATAPVPDGDTLELIRRSRRNAIRTLRITSVVATVIAILMLGLSGLAYFQWGKADRAAKVATIQREVAVGRFEMGEAPVPALRRLMAAGRLNEEAERTGEFAMLDDTYAGLFEVLDSSRELPRLRGYHDGAFLDAFTLSERTTGGDPSSARFLIGTREEVLVTDKRGLPVLPIVAAPDLMPAMANAALWLEEHAFAVASGELTDSAANIAVTIYNADGTVRFRVLSDNAYPFVSLGALPWENVLLAGDAHGNLFKIDTKNGTVERIHPGSGKALIGIAPSYDSLVLAYGRIPEGVVVNDTAQQSISIRFDRDAAKAISEALGKPELKIHALGTQAGQDILCFSDSFASGGSGVVFACESSGGVSIWRDFYEKTWPAFEAVEHIGVSGGVASAMAYSPELDALAIGDREGTIQVFTLQGIALTPPLRHRGGAIGALGFLDGGKTLWSAGVGSEVKRWDLSDIAGSPSKIADVSGSDVVVSADGSVMLLPEHHYEQGNRIALVRRAKPGAVAYYELPKDMDVSYLPIAISANGRRAAWGRQTVLEVADLESGKTPIQLAVPPKRRLSLLTFTPDGNYLLAVFREADIGVDTASPDMLHIYARGQDAWTMLASRSSASVAEISAAAGVAASGSIGAVQSFVVGDKAGSIARIGTDGSVLHQSASILGPVGEALSVTRFAVSGNGQTLLVSLAPSVVWAKPNGTLVHWSLAANTPVGAPVTLTREIQSLAISHDGSLAVVCGKYGRIGKEIWDIKLVRLEGMRLLRTIPMTKDYDFPRALWFGPDGRLGALNRFMSGRHWAIGMSELLQAGAERIVAWDASDHFEKLLSASNLAQNEKRWNDLRSLLSQAAPLRDDVALVWKQLGNYTYNSISKTGDKAAASAAYDKAVEIEPFDILARLIRGRFRYFDGDLAGAEEDLKIAISTPMTYLRVARVNASFQASKSWRTNVETLRRQAIYEPTALLAYTQVARKDWASAVTTFDRLFSRSDGSARDRELHALALAELGRFSDAIANARKAVQALAGPDGRYSNLDGFSGLGDTVPERQMKICDIASSAAAWSAQIRPVAADQAERADWLQQAVSTCGDVWLSSADTFPKSRKLLLDAHAALSKIRETPSLTPELALSPEDLWPVVRQTNDTGKIEAFKTRFAGWDVAALAGRWLAETKAKDTGTRTSPIDITGHWQWDKRVVAIERSDDGGQVWREVSADVPLPLREVISETRAAPGAEWDYVGRHKWGSGDTATWGDDGMLVVKSITPDTLFLAYLDSRYKGGWVLTRADPQTSKLDME